MWTGPWPYGNPLPFKSLVPTAYFWLWTPLPRGIYPKCLSGILLRACSTKMTPKWRRGHQWLKDSTPPHKKYFPSRKQHGCSWVTFKAPISNYVPDYYRTLYAREKCNKHNIFGNHITIFNEKCPELTPYLHYQWMAFLYLWIYELWQIQSIRGLGK